MQNRSTNAEAENHAVTAKVRVLFVCLGNICRSPVADGVFQSLVDAHDLHEVVEVDSAGTSGWHAGGKPDARMMATSARHGVSLDHLRSRLFVQQDLQRFDLILAMDKQNLKDIEKLDPRGEFSSKIKLFRSFDPEPGNGEVPDPYYGGAQGFEEVYTMVERTSHQLLKHVVRQLPLAVQNGLEK